jgi:hypothetical protein
VHLVQTIRPNLSAFCNATFSTLDYDFTFKTESRLSKDVFDLNELMDVFRLINHLYLCRNI